MEKHAIRKSALTGACALVVMGSLSFARSWLLGSWIGGAGAANPIASAFSPGNASLSTSGAALLVLLVLPFSSLLFGYEAGRLARNALHLGAPERPRAAVLAPASVVLWLVVVGLAWAGGIGCDPVIQVATGIPVAFPWLFVLVGVGLGMAAREQR